MITIMLSLFLLDGKSMEHMGFYHGDHVQTVQAPCEVNDVIVFKYKDVNYLKQLTGYGNDCFYVQGRPDIWEENGKKMESLDSTQWGCVDGELRGCVIDKEKNWFKTVFNKFKK